MGRTRKAIVFLFIAAIPSLLIIPVALGKGVGAAPTSFVFTAGGDFSVNSAVSAGLDLIPTTGASFHLALGDFSYSQLVPESAWCDYVKAHVGGTFPFEIVAGNHEDDGPDGLIENFAACLPDRLGNITGEYGKEYYFDYPAATPLARFILISPNLTFSNGQKYTYGAGTARYNWLANTIDDARVAGLRWVIVGMHEDCLSIATKPCEIGADLMNLLISKKVDLVLQAHDHTYQRSKQLAHSATCPAVPVTVFDANCVVDDGSDGLYTAGNGTVFLIAATSGATEYDVNLLDPETGYFVKWMGLNADPRHGFMKYTVSDTAIAAEFIGSTSGSFTDSFTIAGGSATFTPPPTRTDTLIPSETSTPTVTPTSPSGFERLTFAVVADARVKQASPAANYGALSYLSVDGAPDPVEESYLRFNVSGVNGQVQNAKLRVYVTANATNNGPAVYLASNSWTESTLTWNTRPSLSSGPADNKGVLTPNTWVEYDVTSLLSGDGAYTFALIADSTDGAEFSSREGAFPAQLVVTYAAAASTATATRTATTTPTDVPTATASRTPTNTSTSTITALADTPTSTPSATDTQIPAASATHTATGTQTLSPTFTHTVTPQPTSTQTSLPTATATSTSSPTATAQPSQTNTATSVSNPTATYTPTYTATPLPTFTPTATATPTSTRTPTATSAAEVIFADGFESGTLSAWSAAATDGGDLNVSSSAALVGVQGLRAVINNTASIYVTDDAPNAETRYRVRFYFDPNSITMSNGNAHYIFYGYTGTSTDVLRVEFRRSSGTYQLRTALRNDRSSWTSSNWFTISDLPHFLELDWRAATTAGANNGSLTFWIDGTQRANLTAVDNDTRRIDRIRLGAVSGLDSGTLGTYYFDAFESRRQTYIGPAP